MFNLYDGNGFKERFDMAEKEVDFLIPKPKRVKNEELLERCRMGVCIIDNAQCAGPVDPEHLSTRGAGHGDTEDNVYPLCRWHHIEKGQIGIGKMVQKYRSFYEMLVSKGRHDVIEKAKRFYPIIPWEK